MVSHISKSFHFNKHIIAAGSDYGGRVCSGFGDDLVFENVAAGLLDPVAFDEYRVVLESLVAGDGRRAEVLAFDLHPDYFSSRLARKLVDESGGGIRGVPVQHHHAHVVACMAEHGLRGPVIGVALDGTGFGPDGSVWGGEILLADYCGFVRAGHFRSVAMPGGEAAISSPWRMALSYLADAGFDPVKTCEMIFGSALLRDKLISVAAMLGRGINSPVTSSAGRLFDAVSVLLRFVDRVSSGESPAAELEKMCGVEGAHESFAYRINEHENAVKYGNPQFDINELKSVELDFRLTISDIVREIQSGTSAEKVAERFHSTVADAVCSAIEKFSRQTGIKEVATGGGVFFNKRLAGEIAEKLEAKEIGFYLPHKFSPGDASICIGQVIIANALIELE